MIKYNIKLLKIITYILIAFLISCAGSSNLTDNSCVRNNSCSGEWLSFRGNEHGSGSSEVVLNWNQAPIEQSEINLDIVRSMDPRRFLVDRMNGTVGGYIANIGAGVKYFTPSGKQLWSSENLGTGEVVDVVDLDGDGKREIIFSAVQRLNLSSNSASGPGVLWILDAQDGKPLWNYNFDGIQFGLNRYRLSIVDLQNSKSKAILAPQTYDYSLIRFDFDKGVQNAYVKWRSDTFTYDSPDKPPIYFSKGGASRVVVDAQGVLYLIDFQTGKIQSRLKYCDGVTFGGGFNYYENNDGDSYAVVSSNSVYGKNIATLKLSIDKIEAVWKNCIEDGLANNSTSFNPFPSLIYFNKGESKNIYIASSEGESRFVNTTQQLRLRASDTGAIYAQTNVSGELRDILTDTNGQRIFVVVGNSGSEFWKLNNNAQLVSIGKVDGFKWVRPFLSMPGSRIDSNYGFGVAIDPRTNRALLIDLRSGILKSFTISIDLNNVISGGFEGIYATTGKNVVLIQPNGVVNSILAYDPVIYSVPLVADLDGDGTNRVIVSYKSGKAKLEFKNGLFRIKTVWPKIITEEKESLHSPSIGSIQSDGSRDLIGFYRDSGDLFLGAFSNAGNLRWSWPVPADVWESTFVSSNLNKSDKTGSIFYRNSKSTTALNQKTGVLLWSKDYLGECQRQVAAFDWNSDGFIDVGFQAGARTLILDGRSGTTLYDKVANGSYGSNVSIMKNGNDFLRQFIFHGSGGFTAVDAKKGMILDDQIFIRKNESLPAVIGKYGAVDRAYIINGQGELVYFDGVNYTAGKNIRKNIIAMTGAYVDSDEYTDLLISTYDGELIALNGKTLSPIWQKKFNAIPGPAVATTINGKAVVLIVTSDGILRMLSK
jgi:hypothetical protein